MPINLHLNNPNLHKAPSGKAPSETAKDDSHNSLDFGYQRTRWSERARPSPSPTKKPLRPGCRAPVPKVLRASSQFTFWVCHCCFILGLVLTGSLCVDLANLGVPMQTRQASNSDRSACLQLLSVETRGVHCHTLLQFSFKILTVTLWGVLQDTHVHVTQTVYIYVCLCVDMCLCIFLCVHVCENVCERQRVRGRMCERVCEEMYV